MMCIFHPESNPLSCICIHFYIADLYTMISGLEIWHYFLRWSILCHASPTQCILHPRWQPWQQTSFCSLSPLSWALRIKITVLLWRNTKVTVWRCLAKRDLSLSVQGRERHALLFCISELLSCSSMLYVAQPLEVCHSVIWPLHGRLAVGLYPTNMDYVKMGCELTRIC